MVGLPRSQKPAIVIHSMGHGPCVCLEWEGFKTSLRDLWLKSINVEGLISLKVLGRQVTKVEGVQVNYVVSRSPNNLTTPNSLTTPQAASPCLWVPNITKLRPICFKGTENPISASMDQRDQSSTNSRVSRDRGFPPLYPPHL